VFERKFWTLQQEVLLKAFLHYFIYVLLFVMILAENILIYSHLFDVFVTLWNQLLSSHVKKNVMLCESWFYNSHLFNAVFIGCDTCGIIIVFCKTLWLFILILIG